MATVKVRVHAARNLPVMDSTTGLADPYAVVKIDDAEQFTAIAHKTLNPEWDCAFTFDLSDFRTLQEDPVEVRVYDHDIISRDDLVGLVFVDLNSVLTTMASPSISQWFPLSDSINGPRGELRLSVRVKFHSPENPFNPVLPTRYVMPPLSFIHDTLDELGGGKETPSSLEGGNTNNSADQYATSTYREEVVTLHRAEAAKCLRDTNIPLAIAKADKTLLSSVVEGVYLFPMSRLDPSVYRVERIADMVEELLIKSDPEQTLRFGSFQSTRQLNEARQIQLFKLSGQVRRQLTQKVLGMQCNTVLGYAEEFDIEARTILVRAYGTPAVVSKVELKAVTLPPWGGGVEKGRGGGGGDVAGEDQDTILTGGGGGEDVADLQRSENGTKIASSVETEMPTSTTTEGVGGMGSKVSTSICFADNENSPTTDGQLPKFGTGTSSDVVAPEDGVGGAGVGTPQQRVQQRGRRRRSGKKSHRQASTRRSAKAVVTTKRRKRHAGRNTAKGGAAGSGAVDDGASRQEVMLISLASLPNGALVHVAGVVSAKSVKVVARVRSKKAITQERDSWWLEVRSEVRRNARSFHCNAVVGYTEETLYHDNVVVVIATGTAVVVDHSWVAFRRGPAELFYSAVRQFERNDNCAVLHCYDGTRAVRVRGEDTLVGGHVCEACGGYRVPEMLLLTCEAPSELELEGQHRLVEVIAVRAKPDVQGVDLAKAVSQALPMLEYSLHLQLTWKLKFCGFNAGFNFRTRYATNSSLIIAYASVTGARVRGIPIPKAPTHHVSDERMHQKVIPIISRFKDRLTSLESARRSAFAILSTVLGMPAKGITIPIDAVSSGLEPNLTALIPPILATTPTSGWLDFTAYRGKRVFSFPLKGLRSSNSSSRSGGKGGGDSGDSGDSNGSRSPRSRSLSSSSEPSSNETWGTSDTSTTDTSSGSTSDSDRRSSGSSTESRRSRSSCSGGSTRRRGSDSSTSSQSYLSDMTDDEEHAGGAKKRRHGKAVKRRTNLVREYTLRIEDEDDAQMVLGSVDAMADADTALLPAAFIPHHPHDFEVSHPLFVQKCFRVPSNLPGSQRTSFITSCVASIKAEVVSQLRVFAGSRTQRILAAMTEVAQEGGGVANDAASFLYATLNSGMDMGAATAISPDVESLGAVQELMGQCSIPQDSYSVGADLLECAVLQYRQELFFPYDGDELVIIARGMVGGRFNGFLQHLMRARGFSLASFSDTGMMHSFDPCAAQIRGLADAEAATGISTKPKTVTKNRVLQLVARDEQRELAALDALPPAVSGGGGTAMDGGEPSSNEHTNNHTIMGSTPTVPDTVAILPATPSILPPSQAAMARTLIEAYHQRTINLERALYVSATSPFSIPYVLSTHYAIADNVVGPYRDGAPLEEGGGGVDGMGERLSSSANNKPPSTSSPLTYVHNSGKVFLSSDSIQAAAVASFAHKTTTTVPMAASTVVGSSGGDPRSPRNALDAADVEEIHQRDGGGGPSSSQGVVISFVRDSQQAGDANDADHSNSAWGSSKDGQFGPAAWNPDRQTGSSPSGSIEGSGGGGGFPSHKLGARQLLRRLKGGSAVLMGSPAGSDIQAGGRSDGGRGEHHEGGAQTSGVTRSRGLVKDTSVAMGRQWRAISSLATIKVRRWVGTDHQSAGGGKGTASPPSTIPTSVNYNGGSQQDLSTTIAVAPPPFHDANNSMSSSVSGGAAPLIVTITSPPPSSVMITTMEYVPGAGIVEYLGPVSHHFIREGHVAVGPEDTGGMDGGGVVGSSRLTRFFESAEGEMERVVCAFVESVGGNALLCHTVQYHEVYESEGGSSHKVFVFATMTGYAAKVSMKPAQAWNSTAGDYHHAPTPSPF